MGTVCINDRYKAYHTDSPWWDEIRPEHLARVPQIDLLLQGQAYHS